VRLVIPCVLVLAGCGSSWTIRVGEEVSVGCPLYNFYPDADGDGWGDGSVEPVQACEPDNKQGITARNGLDCDETDETITGKVAPLCPGMINDDYAGVVFEGSEFAIVYGEADAANTSVQAEFLCENWAEVDADGRRMGGLATFDSAAELQDVTDEVESRVGDSVYVGFVGLAWDGTSNEDGSWQWTSEDADGSLIESQLNWCGGTAPAPLDGNGYYVSGNPEHAASANVLIETARLALIYDGAGDWCLGFPQEALEPDAAMAEIYASNNAHFICQRQKPVIGDWNEPVSVK